MPNNVRKKPAPASVAVPNALGAQLDRVALGRTAAAALSSSVKRGGKGGKSFADLLSRLYTIADDLVNELETGADASAIAKRSEALKSVAKTLPLLQQAEKNARVAIKRKALEDLTDREVEEAARAVLGRFPSGGTIGAVVPALARQQENPFSEKNPENPIVTDDEPAEVDE